MASLLSYFGGGAAKNNQSKEAIVKLRQQLEMLRKREIHTEKQMLEQDAIARKNVATNKTGQLPNPRTLTNRRAAVVVVVVVEMKRHARLANRFP